MNLKTLRRTVAVVLTVVSATVAFAEPLPLPAAADTPAAAPRAMLPSDLLLNDSFEGGLDYWTLKNATNDKVKCGGIGHIGSSCAVMFKGSTGENSKLQQIYTPGPNVTSGTQSIYFNANVKPNKAGMKAKFFVKVKFKDGAATMKKVFVYVSTQQQVNNNGYSAVEFSTNYFNPASVKQVVIGVQHQSTFGKMLVDAFYVGAYDASN